MSQAKAKEASLSGIIQQDLDVLDTWFSSSLIPLVVAGWPKNQVKGPVLEVMETGHDIIGFWVARMLSLCKRYILFCLRNFTFNTGNFLG